MITLISHFTVKIYILRIIYLSVFPVWVTVRKEIRLIIRTLVLSSLIDLLCYKAVTALYFQYFCTPPPAKCRSKMF